MKLSKGVEWGLHCCVSLSQAANAISATRLAELHAVPYPYLAKHLQALARAGVVSSTAGREGGYALTRPAARITILDVVDAIDGSTPVFRCAEIRQKGPLAASASRCDAPCPIARAMTAAEEAWRASLASISISDLATDIDLDSSGVAMAELREWLG